MDSIWSLFALLLLEGHELYPTGFQLFAQLCNVLAWSSTYRKASLAEKDGDLSRAYSWFNSRWPKRKTGTVSGDRREKGQVCGGQVEEERGLSCQCYSTNGQLGQSVPGTGTIFSECVSYTLGSFKVLVILNSLSCTYIVWALDLCPCDPTSVPVSLGLTPTP